MRRLKRWNRPTAPAGVAEWIDELEQALKKIIVDAKTLDEARRIARDALWDMED